MIGLLEILDRDGLARRTIPIAQWPVTIGRALDNDVVLDDPHVAAHHATLSGAEGSVTLAVGDSVNGAQWTNTRLKSGASGVLPAGEVFQLGATRLRLRLASDAVPPERPMFPEPPAGRVPLPLLIVALFGWTVGSFWLITDPGGRLTDYLTPVLGLAVGLLIWCGVWAFSSKLFRQRFEFWPHTRIAVRYLLLSNAVAFLLVLLSFMLGFAGLSKVSGYVAGAIMCAMLVAHLTRLLPTRRRVVAVTVGSLFVTGVGLMMFESYQRRDRLFDELYASTIAPPALRLAGPVTTEEFLEEAKQLKAAVDAHIADDEPDGMDDFMR